MEDKKIQKYELGYLLAKEEDIQIVMKHLADHGAEIGIKGDLVHIALSYPIKKHDKAHFGWIRFTMPAENAPTLTNALRLDKQIIRTLLIAEPFEKQNRPESESRSKARKAPIEQAPTKEMSNEALEEQLATLQG